MTNLLGFILSPDCCFCSDLEGAIRHGCLQLGHLLLQALPVVSHAHQPVCQLLTPCDQLPLKGSQLLQGRPAGSEKQMQCSLGWRGRRACTVFKGSKGHSSISQWMVITDTVTQNSSNVKLIRLMCVSPVHACDDDISENAFCIN